jgi:hypothetical protein
MKRYNVIEELKGKLTNLKHEEMKLVIALQNEYDKVFTKDKELQADIKALEVSKDYTTNEVGEVCQWIRTKSDLNKYLDLKEFLLTYLSEQHCIYDVDFENQVFMSSQGPSIIINSEGDVLDEDSQEWIISRNDYETKEERNKLIEKYMKEKGYFPGVFYMNNNGSVRFIDTVVPSEKI